MRSDSRCPQCLGRAPDDEWPRHRTLAASCCLPARTKNSRAGHVRRSAQPRTERRGRRRRPSAAGVATRVAVTPSLQVALPSGIRDLSPSPTRRAFPLVSATRRRPGQRARARPVHLAAFENRRVSRRGDVASGRDRPIATRDRAVSKLRTRTAGTGGAREKKRLPRTFAETFDCLVRFGESREFVSVERNETCHVE